MTSQQIEPSSKTHYTFREVDASSGQITRTYVISSTNTGHDGHEGLRLDEVSTPRTAQPDTTKRATHHNGQEQRHFLYSLVEVYVSYILTYLKTLFLPTGYPHTVTPDYTPYQIYDSLQAFASSIAGLLSSRAVLQSLNVISTAAEEGALPADSASAATAATLLSILQSTLSNLTTILFASHAAPRISSDVKFYRFLADVVNDAAFVLDLLAPTLPTSFHLPRPLLSGVPGLLLPSPRVLVLCSSSMLRAVCGVSGGSSKAVLSAHFARNNPESVGDLNAKDGSQETVVNLVGMWVGGVVVSRVESVMATWCWMLGLLTMHLWTNWCAVRSVRLRTLNRERAAMVCEELMASDKHGRGVNWKNVSVESIGSDEPVLGLLSIAKSLWRKMFTLNNELLEWQTWRVGVSVDEFLRALVGSTNQVGKGQVKLEDIAGILAIYKHERYLLWYDDRSRKVIIAFKKHARPEDQLQAFCHGFRVRQYILHVLSSDDGSKMSLVSGISTALDLVNSSWSQHCQELAKLGWDLDGTNLDNGAGIRIDVE